MIGPAGFMQAPPATESQGGWIALDMRKPTAADADSNGDVLWLRSGAWDCLGRVQSGIPADATHWRPTGRP